MNSVTAFLHTLSIFVVTSLLPLTVVSGFAILPSLSNKSYTRGRGLLPLQETEQSAVTDKPTQEWDVDNYQKKHSFVWEYGASIMDHVVFSPGDRILDVGCGTGELTDALYQKSRAVANDNTKFRVLGMDADSKMIDKAQEQFPYIDFFVGDVRNLELEQPVDTLFSNAALHWVPPNDAHRAVSAMARTLKPGGQFVVEFGGKGNVEAIVQAVLEVMDLPPEKRIWYFPSISEYSCLLELEGIQVTTATLFERPTRLEGGEDGVRNWLSMFGKKFFEGMSDRQQKDVLDRVCDKLRPKLYDEKEQVWTADYVRIQMIGRKQEG